MPTLTERRDALLQEVKDILDRADTENRDLTEDEFTRVKEAETQKADLDTRVARQAVVDNFRSQFKGSGTHQTEDDTPATNLGEHFAKSPALREMIDKKSVTRFTVGTTEFKAPPAPSLSTGLGQVQYGGWVELPLERPTVADLFSQGTLAGTSLTYFQQTAVTGGPGWISENTEKPGMVFGGTTAQENLAKLAGIVKVTDETAEDVPALVSIINNQLRVRLALAEEQGLLNGDGVAPNLRGLLGRAIQVEAAADADDNAEAIFRAMTKVQTATFLTADALVMNPLDYQDVRLAQDANGQYYAGGPFQGQYGSGGALTNPPVWGLRTIVTTAIPPKTAIVGNWKAGGQVFRKGGVRVESTNSDADDFRFNRIAIRAEERLLLAVYIPLAFVKVTLI